jgi:hypothetical protein
MGSSSECVEQNHGTCSATWCDCGCHHDLIDEHHAGEHASKVPGCQVCARATSAYDHESFFTAGFLRGIRVAVPEELPDYAFIPRDAVRKPEAWATMRTPADIGPPPFRWEFLEPWTVPEGKPPTCDYCERPATWFSDCDVCGSAYGCEDHRKNACDLRSITPYDIGV